MSKENKYFWKTYRSRSLTTSLDLRNNQNEHKVCAEKQNNNLIKLKPIRDQCIFILPWKKTDTHYPIAMLKLF